jgi:hypothetical protein
MRRRLTAPPRPIPRPENGEIPGISAPFGIVNAGEYFFIAPFESIKYFYYRNQKKGGWQMEIKQLRCKRCGNRWWPVRRGKLPKQCPRCKNPKWHEAKPRKQAAIIAAAKGTAA